MRAEELRIGNIVWDNYSGEMVVFGIVTGGINPRCELRKNEKLPAGSYLVEDIQGIPLTEEWLKRLGFKRRNNAWMSPDKSIDFSIWNEPDSNEYSLNASECNPTIYFVHQLQNLYYALTGTDLTPLNP